MSRSRLTYAFVPRGAETCPFCLMRASRGFIKGDPNLVSHSHSHCDCVVVPGFGKYPEVEGYDPDLYYDLWKHPEKYSGGGGRGGAGNNGGGSGTGGGGGNFSSAGEPFNNGEDTLEDVIRELKVGLSGIDTPEKIDAFINREDNMKLIVEAYNDSVEASKNGVIKQENIGLSSLDKLRFRLRKLILSYS